MEVQAASSDSGTTYPDLFTFESRSREDYFWRVSVISGDFPVAIGKLSVRVSDKKQPVNFKEPPPPKKKCPILT